MADVPDDSKRSLNSVIPERVSSKRCLERERDAINNELEQARKKLKASGSFDAHFWTQSAKIEQVTLIKSEVQRKISLRNFIEASGGSETEWQKTEEAQVLFQKIRAQETFSKIYEKQALRLEGGKKRSLRASFVKLFTSSKMGLNITTTGVGKRDSRLQSKFRFDLIDAYDCQYSGPELFLWCPVMGAWFMDNQVIAAHLFAHMHGQETMDAIFGKKKTSELFSPRNGLMIFHAIEKQFDAGFLVIVPQLPDKPSKCQLRQWLAKSPREYKIRILDTSSKLMGQLIRPDSELRWKDLDNKPLEFRSGARPAARYLYFHYCLQTLRRAWKEPPHQSKNTLKENIGKLYWGTPGRYLPRNMLLAFVEELGHEYEDLLEGACGSTGNDETLLTTTLAQVKVTKCPTNPELDSSDREDDSEDDSEDDEDGDEDDD